MSAGIDPARDTHATEGTGVPIRFRVYRRKAGDRAGHFDEFALEVAPDTTVLDALVAIRTRLDPTLMLRHSCFHASCGTCGMRVNDAEVMACVTKVLDLGTPRVKVEPIANGALLGDLATDMVDFYARLAAIGRALVRNSEWLPSSELPPGIEAHNRYESCIECGLCLSACPVVATDARYLGPAALAAAERAIGEPRGLDPGFILNLIDDPQGAWRCHAAFECTEACPSEVDPAGAIMALRRRAAGARLRSIIRRRT
ncbi:MAG: 2Fe-2S iron-sulfur cluster-binding protein [Candidatus Limnocylindrales bacterium]|jgi:succinate dehydrogenase / fumarate reductase iron-sulfur subunit